MMTSLSFDYRNKHSEARGEVRLKNASIVFKEFNYLVTKWIQETPIAAIRSLVPNCLLVVKPNAFAVPDSQECLSGEVINIGEVKYAVIIFVKRSKEESNVSQESRGFVLIETTESQGSKMVVSS